MTFVRQIWNGFRSLASIIVPAFLLLGVAKGQAARTTLSFTPAPTAPKAGDKYVTATGMAWPPMGNLVCTTGSKSATYKLKAGEDGSKPVQVPCKNKLVQGESVMLTLKDPTGKMEVASASTMVSAGSAAKSAAKGAWGIDVTANAGDMSITVAVNGTLPAGVDLNTIQITGATKTGMPAQNPDGSYKISVMAALTEGTQLTVTLPVGAGGATWQGAVGPASPSGAPAIRVEFKPAPKDTQSMVTGFLSGDPNALKRVSKVYVDVLNGTDVVQGPIDGNYSATTYGFSASTSKALADGQSVHVHVCGESQAIPITASDASNTSVTYKGPTPSNGAAAAAPQLPEVGWNLIDANGNQIGTVTKATPDDSSPVNVLVTISLSSGAQAPVKGQSYQIGPKEESCEQSGATTATVTQPSGQKATGTTVPLVEIVAQSETKTVESLYDWGRVKMFTSLGAEIDASNGSFNSTTYFFGVNIDYNWARWRVPKETRQCFSASDSLSYIAAYEAEVTQDGNGHKRERNACNQHQWFMLFNTFFEGELTQIPVSSSSSNSTPSSSTDEASRTALASGSTTPSSNNSSSTTPNILSAKGGYVEGGIYAPVVLGGLQWRYRGQENALFFAPLVEYGFLEPGNTTNGVTTLYNSYRTWSAGVRFGHFQILGNPDKHSPDLLSYLDVTWGKWEDFRESGGGRGLRMDATGQLKIPYTVFYLGFDVNTGPGGSYYKVFAGARVDASTVLGPVMSKITSSSSSTN